HRVVRWCLQEGAMTVYNLLIGYYAARSREPRGLALGTIAFAAHFLIQDHELDRAHGQWHSRYGRPLLAAAIIGGWIIGSIFQLQGTVLSMALGLVAGGILLQAVRGELASVSETRFAAFVLGAFSYTGLLLATY